MQDQVLELLSARRGHFLLESGHHGGLWLDLELLCLRPQLVQPLAAELARRLADVQAEVICGPLVEGAFVGLMVASALDCSFAYTERFTRPSPNGLFSVGYRVPEPLRSRLAGRRVAIVNDVINAGSAVRGSLADLDACGASVVAIGCLLVLGTAAFEFATARTIPLETIVKLPNEIWEPAKCPQCAAGTPLQDVAGFGS